MPDAVETFFGRYPEPVRDVALVTREVVRRIVPDAAEKLHTGWKMVAYGRRRKFCAISPHKEWVNLQFHGGADLPDPEELLEGTGRSMRHVKLTTARQSKGRALARLIRAAAERAG